MAPAIFVLFCVLIVYAWSNAVNFTDGLDGLAAGAMAMVCAAYVIITFWQFRKEMRNLSDHLVRNIRLRLRLRDLEQKNSQKKIKCRSRKQREV